jgi:outer membrane receptor protein involved in Fe transport
MRMILRARGSALRMALVLQAALAAAPALGDTEAQADDRATFEFTVTERRPVTASSALTIPAEEFELRPLESGGQLVEAVPNAMTAQHTGGGKAEQYFIRGFDADHGTDLAVSFDGVPVNLRSHAHGQGFLDLHFVTPETIERLDATKGPYFARQGDFATAAAIDYVPYRRVDESLVEFGGGEFDTWRGVAALSPRIGPFGGDAPDANALVSFEGYHTDGPFRDDENLSRISLFSRGDVGLGDGVRLSGHALAYYADWDASGLIPERLTDASALSRWGSLDPSEGGESSRLQGKLQLDWQPSDRRHLMVNGYVSYYELDLYSNFTYFLNDPVDGDGIVQKDLRIYAGGRVEGEQILALAIPARLRGGAEWRWDDANVRLGTQTARSLSGYTSDDDVRELSIGPYAEAELLPLPWVRLVGGLRFEVFRYDVHDRIPGQTGGDGHDELWLPKANLVLSPFAADGLLPVAVAEVRDLELFVNLGSGFHSNDARTVENVSGILSRATGAEVGARTRLFDRVELAVDGFWLEIEDELVFVGDEGVTEPSGRSRRLGVELVTRADVGDWLYVRGDVGYTDSRLTRGDVRVAQAPRFLSRGALGVRFAGFATELGLRHFGERYASEDFHEPKLTDYTILDLGMRYRAGRFEVGLALENLTDEEWSSSEFYYESCSALDAVCPQEGRHFTPGNRRNLRAWLGVRL